MRTLCIVFLLSALGALHALAGGTTEFVTIPPPIQFYRGTWDFEGGAGFLGSFSTTSAKRPTINYQLNDLRLGWMYDDPRRDEWLGGWLRGSNEFLLETFGGPVTKGPGSYIAGGSLLWRYNFIQLGARLIPYLQIGAGALDNDVHTGQRQREIGEAFEFDIQGDLGLKYLINDKWSASVEGDYRHISNADLASRNQGLNSIGALMQISYYFH